MKVSIRKIGSGLIYLLILLVMLVVGLAYLPIPTKVKQQGITPKQASEMRNGFEGAHQVIRTADNESLFMRRWNSDSTKKFNSEVAVLILHGITAHSGAYSRAGEILASGGYTTFGLDYRGHGLSGGNRADYSDQKRWIRDLVLAVRAIKSLGYSHVIVMGHSLGVAAAIYVTREIPLEISGLMLLSAAYEGREGVREPPTLLQKAHILANSLLRPAYQVVEYYRDGMTGIEDPLFNFRYTLRFIRMIRPEELYLPEALDIPVLVATGDRDELFEVVKVREFFDQVPGSQKEFQVLQDTYHARFPDKSWGVLVSWLDKKFPVLD